MYSNWNKLKLLQKKIKKIISHSFTRFLPNWRTERKLIHLKSYSFPLKRSEVSSIYLYIFQARKTFYMMLFIVINVQQQKQKHITAQYSIHPNQPRTETNTHVYLMKTLMNNKRVKETIQPTSQPVDATKTT